MFNETLLHSCDKPLSWKNKTNNRNNYKQYDHNFPAFICFKHKEYFLYRGIFWEPKHFSQNQSIIILSNYNILFCVINSYLKLNQQNIVFQIR